MADDENDEQRRTRLAAKKIIEAMAGISLEENLHAISFATAVILRTTMPDVDAARAMIVGISDETDAAFKQMFDAAEPNPCATSTASPQTRKRSSASRGH